MKKLDRTFRYREAVLCDDLDGFYRTAEVSKKNPYKSKKERMRQRYEDKRFPAFKPRRVA